MSRFADQHNSSGLLARLREMFSRPDPEQKRRQWLMSQGRIIEGLVIDIMQQGRSITDQEVDPHSPCTILYRYNTSSVTYESAQVLSTTQLARLQDYRVGNQVSIRYDPRRPANSIVV